MAVTMGGLFKNSRTTLFFVILVAIGAAAFVGDGRNTARHPDRAEASKQPLAPSATPERHRPETATAHPNIDWADGDDLVDDTSGIDPTPPDQINGSGGSASSGTPPETAPDIDRNNRDEDGVPRGIPGS